MKHQKKILLLIIFAILQHSCSYESDELFTNETTEDYQLYDYYIDSYGNEGIVAYIQSSNHSNRKYIIVLSADETYTYWGPMGELVYKYDTLELSALNEPPFGIAMLQSMKSMGIERFPAQAWCDHKNQSEPYPRGGSWRLPSYREFKFIFGKGNHLSDINKALHGIGGITVDENQFYWTCTEDIDDYITVEGEAIGYDQANRAVLSSPTNSTFSNKDRWLKKNKYHVRAIKYVYYHN